MCLAGAFPTSPKTNFTKQKAESWRNTNFSLDGFESLLGHCNGNQINGCMAALDFLESQIQIHTHLDSTNELNFIKDPAERFQAIRKSLENHDELIRPWTASAINQWLLVLDPHAKLVQVKAEEASNSHPISGLGAKLRIYKNRTLVAYVAETSGADQAGIKSGDEILAVNGIYLKELNPARRLQILQNFRPPYTLDLKSKNQLSRVEAMEQKISLPNVEGSIIKDENRTVGEITLRSFSVDSTCEETKDIVRQLLAEQIDELVLDLRNNPGGLIKEANCVASIFLGPDKLVATMKPIESKIQPLIDSVPVDKKRTGHEFNLVTSKPALTQLRLKVLVNFNTASSAEILAGALQDHRRAQIVGSRTYGKGLVQSAFHPWNDPELYLMQSTHQIFRPLGQPIHLLGISPDLITENCEGENFPREMEFTQ